jgi:hypothetical protein
MKSNPKSNTILINEIKKRSQLTKIKLIRLTYKIHEL